MTSTDDSISSAPPPHTIVYDVLGSATAGIISRIFTHPLDTAKARLQGLPNKEFRGPIDTLIRTYKHEGFRALYGGFGAVIVGGTPGKYNVKLCNISQTVRSCNTDLIILSLGK